MASAQAACKRSFGRALSSGEARAKAMRPAASAGIAGADVLQRYGQLHSDGEGAPSRFCCSPLAPPRWRHHPLEGLRGARRRARRPRRRVMIRGDSSDVCGSA